MPFYLHTPRTNNRQENSSFHKVDDDDYCISRLNVHNHIRWYAIKAKCSDTIIPIQCVPKCNTILYSSTMRHGNEVITLSCNGKKNNKLEWIIIRIKSQLWAKRIKMKVNKHLCTYNAAVFLYCLKWHVYECRSDFSCDSFNFMKINHFFS